MRDVQDFPDSKPMSNEVIGLAAPKDRLAAYVLDVTLMLPLVQLVQSPVQRWIFEALLLSESEMVSSYQSLNFVLFICLFVAYYTLMIFWRGQTLGKMFFHVKVVSYHGYLSLAQSFVRAITMFFEFLLLGMPFIGVLTHPMRRPVHDRVADTLVIGTRNPVGFPGKREKWRALIMGQLVAVCLFLSLVVYLLFSGSSVDPSDFDLFAAESCEQASVGYSVDSETLVEVYMAGDLGARCLFEFVRDDVWQDGPTAMTSLALAMATSLYPTQSSQYLAEVCGPSLSEPLCEFSQWMQDSNHSVLKDSWQKKELPDFARVILAAHHLEADHYDFAMGLLRQVREKTPLEDYRASMVFHILLAKNKLEEATWLLLSHNAVDSSDVMHFFSKDSSQQLSQNKKIKILQKLYPQLQEKSGRGLASLIEVPADIADLFYEIKRQQ